MKKILFILLLFSGFVASAQPGYTNINARYGWEAGLFKGFRGPAGDSAQFRAGQAQHAGSQYWDSTDNNTPSGLYIWDGAVWELQSSPVQFCNQFTVLISITYISGFDFAASEGSYNINCVPYNSDSATFRLDTADDDFDRYDVFYADETGVHVLKGVAEELATIPSLEAGQLFIAWVRIPANAITPAISYADIYKENIEWTGSVGSGATANFDNGSNVYMGSKSVYWSAVGNLDNLLFTNGSTVDLGDYDAISIFIRNTQVVAPSANLFLRWENDNAVVSNEVLVRMNKATVGSYQAISIPLSLFTIQNYNANKLRIIYRHSNVAINSGFYIDNIFLESGLVLPGGPGNDVTIVSNIPAITVQESNDNFTLSANGNSSQYIDGTGALRTFNAVTAVGVVNSETKSTNGAVVDGANLILQDVDASFRGLVTPTMKLSWDSVYTVEELSSLGYPIMIPIDEARTGFKRIVFDDEWKNTDSTIHLDTTAAGAAQLFGKIGGDVAAAENRDFATGANQFRLHSNDGSVSTFLDFWDVGNLKIGSDNVGSEGSGGHFNFGSGIITVNNLTASSVSSLKMLAIDTAGGSNILYTTAIPAGGATPNLQEVTDIGNATTTDLTVKNTGGGSLVTLFNFDNAGAISFRATDSSDYSHLRQAGPLTAPQYTFLPAGSGNDTLATLADVRAGGGGSDGNFAENDLTFDGNRTHDLDGFGLTINGGTAATNGGNFTVTAPAGSGATGNGGDIILIGGASAGTGESGTVQITGGLDAEGTSNGGNVIITSGGAVSSDVGSIYLIGANATDQGRGGQIYLTGGNAEGESEGGGEISITGGVGGSNSGNGGAITINGGVPGSGGIPGTILINGGIASAVGVGGEIQIRAGLGGVTSGNGGALLISGGNADGDGDGGNLSISSGAGAGAGDPGIIQYTGLSHNFIGNTFQISDYASNVLASTNGSTFTSFFGATDETASTYFTALADLTGTDVYFDLTSDDGTNPAVSVRGDGIANTLAYTAANGHTFTGSILPVSDNSTDIGSASVAFQDIYGKIINLDGSTSDGVALASDALGNTFSGTVLSGTGTISPIFWARETSNVTLANSTAEQAVFSSGQDEITVTANTTYRFWGTYYTTHGATSHNVQMGFTPTTATISSIFYYSIGHGAAANTQITTQTTNYINQATSTAVMSAGANAAEAINFSGTITIGTGGTLKPFIKFSADPTGTILILAGTEIFFQPMGTNTVTATGPFN